MDSELYVALTEDAIDVLKEKDWLQVRDQMTPTNNSVLHLACQHGSNKCVQEILERADESLLLKTNSRGETALHLAARQGHYDIVGALINKAKSCDNDLENTTTVLQNLIRACNVELETALHAAVRYNHKKVVGLLVKEDPGFSYPRNKFDETPLYLAAVRGYGGVTKLILDNCESPTFGGPHGRTALHAAAMSSTGYGCMRHLLRSKENLIICIADIVEEDLIDTTDNDILKEDLIDTADNDILKEDLIDIADNDGWTAFHFAADNNLLSSIGFLLGVNSSVAYLPDKKHKKTALHVAAYKGYHSVVEILLEYLPDMWDSVDGNGQNILHIAVQQYKKPLLKFILSQTRKFDTLNTLIIQRDQDGNTPLHLVAKLGYNIPEMREWVQKTDHYIVDNTNLTPSEMTYQNFSQQVMDEDVVGIYPSRDEIYELWIEWTRGRVQTVDKYDQIPAKEKITMYQQMANSHMIVAALVTTVALTAGFTVPGGFDSSHGSPLLLGKPAFKIFMIADTLALLFSISALFLYFSTSFQIRRPTVIFFLLTSAVVLNVISIAAMMVAFIAGTFAVLYQSLALAIIVCLVSSSFLLLVVSLSVPFIRRYMPVILILHNALRQMYRRFKYTLYAILRRIWRRIRYYTPRRILRRLRTRPRRDFPIFTDPVINLTAEGGESTIV